MIDNLRQWVCRRLGCLNKQYPTEEDREKRLTVRTEQLDKAMEGIESSRGKLESAVVDIHIQKHALEAFARELKK